VRFGWTPQQVAAMDPDFVDELIARLNADVEVDAEERKKQQRKGRRGQGGWVSEDVDLAEIKPAPDE